MRIARRKSNNVEIVAFKKNLCGDGFPHTSSPIDFIAVRRQIREIFDVVQQDIGFETGDSGRRIDRLVRQKAKRNASHLRPRRVPDQAQRRRTRIDRLNACDQFVRPIGVRTIETVIPAAFPLIEHDVEKWRQGGIGIAVKPNLDRVKVRRVSEYLFLLRRPKRDVGMAAVGAPTLQAGANAESCIGKSDPLIDFVFIGVRW